MLTPNSRLARRIGLEWGAAQVARGLTAWEPLAVFHVDNWLRQQWQLAVERDLLEPRAVLGALQEQQLWQRVIGGHAARTDALPLLRLRAAAELASEARQRLRKWRLDPSASGLRQLFLLESDCRVFLEWLTMFDQELAASGFCTAADCCAALAALDAPLQHAPVLLIECEELSPLERACIERCAEVVDRLPEAGQVASCELHAFADQRAELEGAAAWAAALHAEQPEATIGIVLPDTGLERVGLEYLLRREFGCLGDDYASLPVNFSTGIRLAEAPVVRDALAALAFGQREVAVRSVVSFLHSRFIGLADTDSPLAQDFRRRLLDNGSDAIDVGELRNFATGLAREDGSVLEFGARLAALFEQRELRRTGLPSEWARRFGAALDLWGWPGPEPLDSLEYQQVTLWYGTLEALGALDGICGPLGYDEALALLREACERQASHPQTVDSPLQVLGALEAVGLSFDHLWLLGMQASAWPAPPRPNPFLPVSLQARHDMPHATTAREWDFGATLLAQYRRANRVVHASYAQEADGVVQHPSALVAEFVPRSVQPSTAVAWQQELCAGRLEAVADRQAPAPDDAELAAVRGGAALLEHQSLCPFRAFSEHRLHVAPLPENQPGLTPAERGNLAHEALQQLWEALGDHDALVALDEAAEASLLDAVCGGALPSLPGYRRRALGRACLELEVERLRALLGEWLLVERQRGDFAIAALEKKIEVPLGRLAIRLRIDRIDTLPDGSQVIIDYKTGRAQVRDWMGPRPSRPQMLLYGLATPAPPAALAFAQVRPGDCQYVGVGEVDGIRGIQTDIAKASKEGEAVADWAALNAHWAAVIRDLVDEFLTGVAGVAPKDSTACTYCGQEPLCRIDFVPDDD